MQNVLVVTCQEKCKVQNMSYIIIRRIKFCYFWVFVLYRKLGTLVGYFKMKIMIIYEGLFLFCRYHISGNRLQVTLLLLLQ
jgi:hypothetical protein